MKFNLITDFSVAYESRDHTSPHGTANDNYTNHDYINEVLKYFNNKKINYLDLGCSGGQLAIDFLNLGNNSVGLEGSDYSLRTLRANWPNYYGKNLFTCDISKPFKINDENGSLVKFNCISAWEVLEHIPEKDLPVLMENIYNHLEDDGIFVGSVSKDEEYWHVSVFSEDYWEKNIFNKFFTVEPYPFLNKVRQAPNSFYVLLKKRKT